MEGSLLRLSSPAIAKGHPSAGTSTERLPTRRFSPSLFCWSAYLISSPFYVFQSGYPQPSDVFMALFMALNLAFNAHRLVNPHSILEPLLLFVGYTTVINLTWYAIYDGQEEFFLLSAAYYIYNALIVYNIIVIYSNNGGRLFATYTRYSLLVALVVELVITVTNPTGAIRSTGTFNDPNQFGYWLILVGSCWLVLKGREKLTLSDSVVLSALMFLVAHTVSRSSMLAAAVLLLVAVFAQGVRRGAVLGLVILGLAVAWAAWNVEPVQVTLQRLADNAAARWTEYQVGQGGDETFAERGYARIWTHPEHLLFGAGEGAYDRFDEQELELHSSLGTMLFSYGIIGASLFVWLLWRSVSGSGWHFAFYALPFLVYGVFNYGLRFSLLWVLLGVLFCMSWALRDGNTQRRRDVSPSPSFAQEGSSAAGTAR